MKTCKIFINWFFVSFLFFYPGILFSNELFQSNGAVVTSNALATKVGEKILADGGNAYDAATAISAMLSVVEPFASGLGGGAFWDIASYPFSAVLSLFEYQEVKILFSEIIKRNESLVDTDGLALLRFSNGTLVYLEWGMNLSYRNEIDVWSENGSLFMDKVFSKPPSLIESSIASVVTICCS